ncbi:MAG: oxidoreductase [Chitinophagaceae bacterium]|nr:oxidoreductase [Chitinophagaceae bacterium]
MIGAGHIGKRHVEMICKSEEAELSALIDIKPKEQLGLNNFSLPFFTSLNDFLKSNIEVDVINIATPNGLHAAQAMQCLDKNLHVVIEKPLALKKQDAESLINKARDVDKHIFTVMQNRYSPPSAWLKKIVSENILGKIFMVQINCYWNRDGRYYQPGSWHGNKQLDGGTLFTQFSHFIDIMYWVFGDVQNIKSKLCNFNHHHLTEFEDSGLVNFDFINGGIGCINYSTSVWDKNFESSMTIIAENGSVKIGGQYMDTIEYCHVKNYTMPDLHPTNPGNDYGTYKGSAANHHYVIKNIIDVLKQRAAITTNGFEGLKVVDIIERIYNANIKTD